MEKGKGERGEERRGKEGEGREGVEVESNLRRKGHGRREKENG